jgi:hypothetical protein
VRGGRREEGERRKRKKGGWREERRDEEVGTQNLGGLVVALAVALWYPDHRPLRALGGKSSLDG